MGKAKRRAAKLYGGNAHLVEAEMRIVRFRPAPGQEGKPQRVEVFLGGFSYADGREAVRAIHSAFAAADARRAAMEAAQDEYATAAGGGANDEAAP